MSEPTNNQTMIPYLLGNLPAAETERLDKLSVSDGDFADALRAAEHDLVDAYVQGELSGADLEGFETHYLASPLRRQRLAFAETFQAYAEKDAPARAAAIQREASAAATANRNGSTWRAALQNFKTRRLAMQWGLAFAAAVLLVAGSWLVFENVRMRRQASEAEARRDALSQQEQELQRELEGRRAANAVAEQDRVRQERERLEQQPAIPQRGPKEGPSPSTHESILSLVLTPQLRGSSEVPSVRIPAKTAYVSAQLRLDPNDYSAYRVALIDPAGSRAL
ncbi:MAG: hypothetical protein ABJB97_11465, partial [Acidobacteriota bacterium]